MIFTLKDKNVYFAGKVVGTVIDIKHDPGLRAILSVNDAKIKESKSASA